ncbi:coat protein [Grapevine virus I]|uniref:Coat protein n=13 Tax=Grapevine virus I TaxID=2052157 RepID=A0A2K8JBC9_9VIRU|nr:coat protein [Grapevine virus I]ATS17353.1 coat protein [Grapevine virus I]
MESKEIRKAVLQLLSVKVPGLSAEPKTPEELVVSSNILSNIFGQIAIVGTSSAIESFPEELPLYDLATGRLDDTKTAGANLKLGEIIFALASMVKMATQPPMAGLTLRQVCTPFAAEAYIFLKTAAASKVYTNLARKMTRIGNKEPQVVFDFAKGLAIGKLTRSEASCIQVMHQRLFRTEGAKSVFDAQSQVGENSVEV